MRSRATTFLTVLSLALLAGCATPGNKEERRNGDILTADTILKPAPPLKTDDTVSGISVSPDVKANRPPPTPEINIGTAKFVNPQPAPKASSGEGQVTFNFENQPIQAVVKAILGDMLQENYTVAPNVGGNVTYSTSRPIRREDALPVLEMLLSWTGNALVREGGRYTVLQSKDAIPGKLTPRLGVSQQPGYGLRIFPLKYISASETAKLLKPYAKADAFVQIDPNRSLLVLAGTPSELDNYQRTIDTFDVDWMKGMSIGVFTLQHVEVGKMIPDLQKLFGTEGESPLAGMFRFMPIESTNSIVAITPQPEYLKQAEEWLYRLDRGGAENAQQLYIYNVKNLKAPDLADYLSEIFLGTSGGSRRSSTSGRVGQGLRSTSLGSRGGVGGSNNNLSYGNSLRPQSSQEKNAPAAATPAAGGTTPAASGSGKKETDIRISAIEENNQLMIMAQPFEWEQIQSAIRRLDVVPLQVQIEARILEVTLNGNLSYGVQWYLNGLMGTATGSAQENGRYPIDFSGNRWDRHRLSLGATGNVAPTNNGGFFYSFLSKNFEVAISALESSGVAKSLAAPSLLVMNNQEAQINVGQQIPVQQTYFTGLTGTNSNGNTIGSGYGTVQYLNTGVTLSVKPRVNPGGLIYLDIEQEVSNPGTPPANGNGNPPINQRLLQTQVAVQSGETLLLGGLIQDNRREGETGLPLVSKVPVLRNLFGSTTKNKDRTELIVLITPRVLSSVDEARQATLDYTNQFESLAPLRMKGEAVPQSAQPQAPAPEPARTYPIPEHAQPQEDTPRDR
ncbi:type II secretion system secretin GspD [Dokdonella sp.]|uniref:type II secretion system secretin GspD n=1 Tax=Dokdonella sp. TaxID=2291710 RepID=UPI0025C3A9A9|nr:type II secretion system secretin GspD [Dokdonella sp.]